MLTNSLSNSKRTSIYTGKNMQFNFCITTPINFRNFDSFFLIDLGYWGCTLVVDYLANILETLHSPPNHFPPKVILF